MYYIFDAGEILINFGCDLFTMKVKQIKDIDDLFLNIKYKQGREKSPG